MTALRRVPVDPDTLAEAGRIVADVKARGETALREHAERLGDVAPGAPMVLDRTELEQSIAEIPPDDVALLQRSADRIRVFAQAQRASLANITVPVSGGRAGHTVRPVKAAACYAPGGRFPLPSSALMTVVTARAAGVRRVWVASPRPAPIVRAAAAIAGADALLAVGGAHAIAALAYGAGPIPTADVIAGPGNRWVTAAKQIVSGHVGIDMLAGPSELLVVADRTSDPATVAADLLAQAEHDPDALPVLVSLDPALPDRVDAELTRQLVDLPTRATAEAALTNGWSVVVGDIEEAVHVSDHLAPEHLQVVTENAEQVWQRFNCYGAIFVGDRSAEVMGDYAAGPNHTLPTGRTGRFTGGLSVFDFVAVRTWLRLDGDAQSLVDDAVRLGRIEGLEAHARAAERRAPSRNGVGEEDH